MMMNRMLAGKLPKKKVALAVVGNPAGHTLYIVLLCQQRINLGPKRAKAWMEGNPMPAAVAAEPENIGQWLMANLPLGSKGGGLSLQFVPQDFPEWMEGNKQIFRLVWWEKDGLVHNIKEQMVDFGIPDDVRFQAYLMAWVEVVADVLAKGDYALMPDDLVPSGSKSVFKLKGRSYDEYDKALRGKSRLGKWL